MQGRFFVLQCMAVWSSLAEKIVSSMQGSFNTPMHGRPELSCRADCFFHAGKFWYSNAWKTGALLQSRLFLPCREGFLYSNAWQARAPWQRRLFLPCRESFWYSNAGKTGALFFHAGKVSCTPVHGGLVLRCRVDCFFHAGKVFGTPMHERLVLTCRKVCFFHAGKVFGTPMHERLVLTCRKVCFFHAGKVFGAPMPVRCREGFWYSNA